MDQWPFTTIYDSAKIGKNTKIGNYTEIGDNVSIGDNCLIQAFVFIPKGVTIGNNVFIGPGTIFTNDKRPPSDKQGKIIVKDGARIGGGCVILPYITIGKSLIGAGSVVTKSIPDGEMWLGNPARFVKKL